MHEGGCAMSYTLPIASDVQLGGIKVGSKLTIDSEGVLDVDLSDVQAGIDKYENTSAETLDDLLAEGQKRLSELINTDTFHLKT